MIVDVLFAIRMIALMLAGFWATRAKDYVAFGICLLYIISATINFYFANPALTAIFSTPLVFLTTWYIIKHSRKRYHK